MNRIKVWVYVLAVAAAAYAGLRAHTARLRAAALTDLDARLAAVSAQALDSTRALEHEVSSAAAIAARDPRLFAALHATEPRPPPPAKRGKKGRPPPAPRVDPDAQEATLREAARSALDAAEKTMGFDLPNGTVITAANRDGLARKGKAGEAEGDAMAFLRGAAGGKAQRGHVRLNGVVYQAAAVPAGDGAGLVVLAPVDERWLRGLGGASGAAVTLSAPDAKPASTAGADAKVFAGWNRGAGTPVSVGQLGRIPVSIGPVKLPALPPPFGDAPAYRARAVQLVGLKGGVLVAALPAAPVLGPIAEAHWLAVLGIAVAAIVGIVLGLFVRSSEAPAAVPKELLAAATRIERGDFAARVPPLAGKLGTVGAALNRAAELAGPAAAAQGGGPSEEEHFAQALQQFEPPARPSPPPAPTPAPAIVPPAPRAAPALSPEEDEEAHFQQVFEDFLQTRESCGEGTDGLTYDKFRVKLDGNKAALVSKYGCRTVRFQVYVKDGKAALKATPVK